MAYQNSINHNVINKQRNQIEAEKYGEKLYKLMNNAVCGKVMEKLRNKIDVKLVSNERDYLKCTSKHSYIT